MKIGVFCSANNNIDNDYFRLTEEFGEWIGSNGHALVYGGCNCGLMGAVGEATHRSGGMTIGVVPRKVEDGGLRADCLDVHIPCDNLSDRKDLILLKSDVLVALPGGIGTLDEIFTVAAGKTIGYHNKRVILYNMNGFWTKTIELLDDMKEKGMLRGDYHAMITAVDSFENLVSTLENI